MGLATNVHITLPHVHIAVSSVSTVPRHGHGHVHVGVVHLVVVHFYSDVVLNHQTKPSNIAVYR